MINAAMDKLGAFSLAMLLAVSALGAQQPPAGTPAVDVTKLGPQVGEPVPDFTLPDQTGRTHTVKSILGPNGAMLVFYRSADW